MRIAYADPPYPGQARRHYGDHPDYGGEVNHADLIQRLMTFDAWVLHTSTSALSYVYACLPLEVVPNPLDHVPDPVRTLAWVKPFAAFKPNRPVSYAWEPVIVWGGRKGVPNRIDGLTLRDFIAEPITMQRGLTGAKPERVCWWLFEVLGCEPDDELVDLFPGTGAVTEAWERWRRTPKLAVA